LSSAYDDWPSLATPLGTLEGNVYDATAGVLDDILLGADLSTFDDKILGFDDGIMLSPSLCVTESIDDGIFDGILLGAKLGNIYAMFLHSYSN